MQLSKLLLLVNAIVDKNCWRAKIAVGQIWSRWNIVGENSVGEICVDDVNGTHENHASHGCSKINSLEIW